MLEETIFLGDQPVAVLKQVVTGTGGSAVTTTSVYNVFADQQNTPRVITRTSDNQIVWRWDSGNDPFGFVHPNENPSAFGTFTYNQRFPGQLFDVETNTHYNINRDYDPQLGSYLQSDPIGLNGGQLSTFSYVNGDPTNNVDPQGLIKWSGTSYNFGVVDVIGASYTELDLWSECDSTGKSYHIIVKAVGPSVGLGVKVASTISDISFDDSTTVADPNSFNGSYKSVGGAVTFGAIPIKGYAQIGLGLPGLGISQGASQFGTQIADFSVKPGASIGRDYSISGTIGSSTVTFIDVKNCTCKK